MRHLKKGRKFGRKRSVRRSFLKGLTANLILSEKIETTEARAKEVRPKVEKLVTLAKKQNLAALRLLLSRLPKEPAHKLYYEIAPRYLTRRGGYVRIVKGMKPRKRDAAVLVTVEFI